MRKPTPMPSVEILRSLFSYDEEAGILYRKPQPNRPKNWNSLWAGKPCGHSTPRGYIQVGIGHKSYLAHRLIWKLVHGEEPVEVDHIDGDTTNNRLSNLRNASVTGNVRNRSTRVGKDLPLGVFRDRKNGRIYAKFCGNGSNVHLGTFDNAQQAGAAYDAYASKFYGEYARPNSNWRMK